MPSWNDLGTAVSTLRELDVTAIREESERPVMIACLGPRALFDQVYGLLRDPGAARYGPAGRDPLVPLPLAAGEPRDELRRADLALAIFDAREPVSAAAAEALAGLGRLGLPTVVVICGVAAHGEMGRPRPEYAHAKIVVLPDLAAPEARGLLAEALLDRLPSELHLAAARALPGLRDAYSRELIGSVSFTNATYSFASAVPSQLPILSVPFAAADIIVLTKNQAMMVYRLALAHGAPPEFQARIAEVAPVVGGAFVWRQLARTLVGLIPVWGVVPKVAVAYSGTYVTGVAALRWFAEGELLSRERLRQLASEALKVGRKRAQEIVDAAREKGGQARIRLPWQRKGRPELDPGAAPDSGE